MDDRRQTRTDDRPQAADRRKKTDWVTKAASILSVVAWLIAITMLLCLERAQPQRADFFTYFFGVTINSYWNTSLLRAALVLLLTALGICALAMVFNIMRSRRKTDKYKKSIIILGVITLAGLIAFLTVFGPYL